MRWWLKWREQREPRCNSSRISSLFILAKTHETNKSSSSVHQVVAIDGTDDQCFFFLVHHDIDVFPQSTHIHAHTHAHTHTHMHRRRGISAASQVKSTWSTRRDSCSTINDSHLCVSTTRYTTRRLRIGWLFRADGYSCSCCIPYWVPVTRDSQDT